MRRHRIWVHLALTLLLLAWSPMALANSPRGGHCPPTHHPHHNWHWHGYYGGYGWYWPYYYESVPTWPQYQPPVTQVFVVTGVVTAVHPPPTGQVGSLIVTVVRSIPGGREETRIRYLLTQESKLNRHGEAASWAALKPRAPVTVHVMQGVVVRVEMR
jgi:hypothetical protein